jgi:hypothetical protein
MPIRFDDRARAGIYASYYLVDAPCAELIGVCRGVLADNHVNDDDIKAIDCWLDRNLGNRPAWPTRAIAERIKGIVADGVIADEERLDVTACLLQLAPPTDGTTGEAPADTQVLFRHG